MRKLMIASLFLLGGCATLPSPTQPTTMPTSQRAVVTLELDYVHDFLVPATSYTLLPRCPAAADAACSDPVIVARLRTAETKVHNAIYAARDLSDAAPDADVAPLIANARRALDAAETILPKTGAKP
jgi:hypothetical protein